MQKTIIANEQIVQRANRAPYVYYALFALFLTAFILYTRIRYQAPYLYSWDSISFALSIERFDMRRHQPHPPGYPLYSYTIRLLDHFVSDPNRSMIYLNIASTLGACWFIAKLVYLLTKNRIAAGGAALLYAVNPVSWFYGSVAEIYATEGFWVSLIAYLVLVSHDRRRYLIWASAAMAIAGGFRPTTEVFLLPFYATGYFRKSYSTVLQALSILVIGNLLWLWPLILSAGGLPEYVDAVLSQSQRAAEITGEGTAERMTFAKASVRIVQTITFPVLIALFLRLKKIKLSWKESSLLLAVLPPLVVFTIIHFPKDGYLLLVIPFVIAIAVLLLHKVITSPGKLTAVISLGCLISVIGFVRPIPAGGIVDELTRPNQQIIAQRMQRLKRFFTVVDGLGGGQHKTFVLENRHYFPNWRMLLYYYPDHTIYLVWPNKRRAYVAGDHEYRTVQPPLPVHPQSTLITVGRTTPAFSTQSFHVEAFRYYFVEPGTLPRNFQLYSMAFVVQANE